MSKFIKRLLHLVSLSFEERIKLMSLLISNDNKEIYTLTFFFAISSEINRKSPNLYKLIVLYQPWFVNKPELIFFLRNILRYVLKFYGCQL